MEDMGEMCGRCYDFTDELFKAKCEEHPERLGGCPIGQYHCPDCGAMVMAGVPHPTVCKLCRDHKHPMFDLPETDSNEIKIKDKCQPKPKTGE